jgi:hypothetical protein
MAVSGIKEKLMSVGKKPDADTLRAVVHFWLNNPQSAISSELQAALQFSFGVTIALNVVIASLPVFMCKSSFKTMIPILIFVLAALHALLYFMMPNADY